MQLAQTSFLSAQAAILTSKQRSDLVSNAQKNQQQQLAQQQQQLVQQQQQQQQQTIVRFENGDAQMTSAPPPVRGQTRFLLSPSGYPDSGKLMSSQPVILQNERQVAMSLFFVTDEGTLLFSLGQVL